MPGHDLTPGPGSDVFCAVRVRSAPTSRLKSVPLRMPVFSKKRGNCPRWRSFCWLTGKSCTGAGTALAKEKWVGMGVPTRLGSFRLGRHLRFRGWRPFRFRLMVPRPVGKTGRSRKAGQGARGFGLGRRGLPVGSASMHRRSPTSPPRTWSLESRTPAGATARRRSPPVRRVGSGWTEARPRMSPRCSGPRRVSALALRWLRPEVPATPQTGNLVRLPARSAAGGCESISPRTAMLRGW